MSDHCEQHHKYEPECLECLDAKAASEESELAPAPGSVAFVCEACGLQGEVDNPKHMESVSCPECNARYLYWPDGLTHGEKSPWKCVVRPVFLSPPTKTEW